MIMHTATGGGDNFEKLDESLDGQQQIELS